MINNHKIYLLQMMEKQVLLTTVHQVWLIQLLAEENNLLSYVTSKILSRPR